MNEDSTGSLKQMSDDMKHHIAQLKAELNSSELTSKRVTPEVEANMCPSGVETKQSEKETSLTRGGTEKSTTCGGSVVAGTSKNLPITLESLECCEDECSDPFSGTTAPLERTHDSVRLPVQELLTSASDRVSVPFTDVGEDSVPVKYLQMSSTSPKVFKKNRLLSKGKSSSTPNSARGCRNDLSKHLSESSLQSCDEAYRVKCEQLQEQVIGLQMQCKLLVQESAHLRKEERSKAVEKIIMLKKNNGELANIAKKLEEKARSLQEQNAKKSQEISLISGELQQQKRHYHRHKARWEAEMSRVAKESNDDVNDSKEQVDDLKRALRLLRREKYAQKLNEGSSDESGAVKHMEIMRLQKLAAASSSKVIVRSLSTPSTARQKILEESNKDLRKQLSALEARLGEAEIKLESFHDVEGKLEELNQEKWKFHEDAEGLKSTVMVLKAELEQAKVETSDISLQLKDLKHVHGQVQNAYSTVHEQLSVAIHERDEAVQRCVQEGAKVANLRDQITCLKNEKENEEKRCNELKKLIESQHRTASLHLQENSALKDKVMYLEKQCQVKKEEIHKMSVPIQWSGKGEDAVLSKTTSSSVKSLPVVQSDSSCDESISSFHENSDNTKEQRILMPVEPSLLSDDNLSKNDGKNSHCETIPRDLLTSSVLIDDVPQKSNVLPYPQDLHVSFVPPHKLAIDWKPPSLQADDHLQYFDVILNGCLMSRVDPDVCKLLLDETCIEGVNDQVVSVCCVMGKGRSDPGHCIASLTSQRENLTIQGLLCEYTSITSSRIMWSPFNSSCSCKISIGEVSSEYNAKLTQYDRQILVPRAMYKQEIDGLKSNTTYEVVVKATLTSLDNIISSRPLRFKTPHVAPPPPPTCILMEESSKHVIFSWTMEEVCSEVHGYHLYMNGLAIAFTNTNQCHVERYRFAQKVVEMLKKSLEWRLPTGEFLSIPPVCIGARSVSDNGSVSDISEPFLVPSVYIQTLLRNVDGHINIPDMLREEMLSVINQSSLIDAGRGAVSEGVQMPFFESGLKGFSPKPEAEFTCSASLSTSSVCSQSNLSVHSSPSAYNSSSKQSSRSSLFDVVEKTPDWEGAVLPSSRSCSPIVDPVNEKTSSAVDHIVDTPPSLDWLNSHTDDVDSRSIAMSCQSNEEATKVDVKEGAVSLYVALFDYTPSIMSPNNESYQDELAFVESQLIKVHGVVDEDGFFMGEDRHGQSGLVPSNMVVNVEVDDFTMLETLFERGFLSTTSPHSLTSSHDDAWNSSSPVAVDIPVDQSGPPHHAVLYRALYDYDPRQTSPNIDSEVELTFARGDLIKIYGPPDEDGFFRGELHGQYGLIPSNFVHRDLSSNSSGEHCVVTSSTKSSSVKSVGKVKKKSVFSKGKKLLKKMNDKPRR